MMKCPYCLGEAFQRGKFDLAQVVEMQPVLIRNVPGLRCKQCGYIQVSASTMKKLEKAIEVGLPDTVVPSAVFDLDAQPRRSASVGRTHPAFADTAMTQIAV